MLTDKEKLFIQQHLNSDITRLILKSHQYPELDIKKLANQIAIRKKAMAKLPTWAEETAIFFPPSISWQQCSSEFTAQYKANILKGKTIVDLTGGFGVDAFYFAQTFESVTYIEQNETLAAIAAYNYNIFNQNNIKVINDDSLDVINDLAQLDVIYLDPARRNKQQKKVITLEDSTPNIINIQEILLKKATYVMLKTSPMLDVHKAIRSLQFVQSVHVIAVENECKELLFVMSKNNDKAIKIHCANISKKGNITVFESIWGNKTKIVYSDPKKYLYDPNKAIHKGNISNAIGEYFNIEKLAANTNLYTSEKLVKNFHGRIFELIDIVKPSRKEIQRYLPNKKANLIVRNFPESVANLRKMWKIKDGGQVYLFAVTLANKQKMVLIATRLN